MEKCGYKEIDHTADLALLLWADNPRNLFIQAAQGLYHLAGVQLLQSDRIEHRFELETSDLEGLLVSFLNELLFKLDEERVGYDQFILEFIDNKLTCSMIGTKVADGFREVKAATYHHLKVLKQGDRYEAMIVFDV